jgi:hypothetical protein
MLSALSHPIVESTKRGHSLGYDYRHISSKLAYAETRVERVDVHLLSSR